MEARLASLLLPEPAAMDKILRYETSIKRQLPQDIGLLIALQSRRLSMADQVD